MGMQALKSECVFVNCIPTVFAQKSDIAEQFRKQKLPLLGDDIKSQVGSTILHRSVLNMLKDRGAKMIKSS
jgi:myo-inositol-1-phosphate synthase